jgi:archaellin
MGWFGSISLRLFAFATVLSALQPAYGIPAFARKYGLPCSACHEAWPMLNNFGQHFKDNGYQLGNDRDSPIYQEPSYWPIMFRTTPTWHRENNNRQLVDAVPGNPAGGQVEASVTSSGFDLNGLDVVTAGTLYNNISFFVQPFIGSSSININQSWVRFDNLLHSHWLNFKMGKFELDEPISQERSFTVNNTGAPYYTYFFTPTGDNNAFIGIGLPQLGAELSGHSDTTRYSVAVITDSNGVTGLPTNQDADVYANFNQSFEAPHLGWQQVGVYGFFGESPTYFQTSGGTPIPGTGQGNRSFYRLGAYGHWYVKQFDFYTFFMHGYDNVFLGNATPANQPASLPIGAVAPTWNGGFVEAHYNPTPRWVFLSRYELERMSRQANANIPGRTGNLDTWTVGYRWYPIMSPRAGLAWLQEYSRLTNEGAAPLSSKDDVHNSYLMGFDFDF